MGREQVASGQAPITSVVLSKVTRYADRQRPELGPSVDNFELFLDFQTLSPESRTHCNAWNRRATEVFTNDFVGNNPTFDEHRKMVASCFTAHLRQLVNQFVKFNAMEEDESHYKAVQARKVQLRRKVRIPTDEHHSADTYCHPLLH